MRKPIIALISTILLSLPNIAVANQDTRTFGQPGNNGNHGYHGSLGSNGKNRDIFADGQPQTYDLSGTDGKDGTDGTSGYHAINCQQPQGVAYHLRGANGGNGGHGGNGGNGGDGGDFTIFYNDTAHLKQVIIDNSGGNGGKAGRGASEGMGCSVTESQWQVKYCSWELWYKRQDIPDSQWQADKRTRTRCTGLQQVDAEKYMPPTPKIRNNLTFQWKYLGVSQAKTYQASEGKPGKPGKNGRRGNNGSYGRVTLIPRGDIPPEKVSYGDSLSHLIGKRIDLARNIWSKRQGLRSLLNAASEVPDSYTYLLSTANLSYRLDWEASETPEELEVADIKLGGEITLDNLEPKLSLDLGNIPGTIEYQLSTKGNLSRLAITGGFAPSRVESFEIEKYGGNEPYELILRDRGNIRELLTNTKITVATYTKKDINSQSSEGYRLRDTVEFEAPPDKPPRGSITITDNQYILNLGKNLFPWLRSGSDIRYRITLTQTTKSGKDYSQVLVVDFVVP